MQKRVLTVLVLTLAMLIVAAVVVWAALPKGGNGEYAFTARVLASEGHQITVELLEQHPGFLVRRLPEQFTFEEIPDAPALAPGDVIAGMVMPASIQKDTARVMTYEIVTE